jgi:hypothetical protein
MLPSKLSNHFSEACCNLPIGWLFLTRLEFQKAPCLQPERVSEARSVYVPYKQAIIYSIALPPKIPLWHLPEHWWICIYRWCVYLYGRAYTFSQALKLWQSYLHLWASQELQKLNGATYCPISQTTPYAAFHIAKLIKLEGSSLVSQS